MANYGGWELSDFPAGDTERWRRRLVGLEREQYSLQAKSDLTKEHLTRTVSALANSHGGVLLVGVATEDRNDTITGLPGLDREIHDQWVENVIKTGVEPCPNLADYRVHAVPGEADGRQVYAIFVPESAGGPHQDVKTGVYWNTGIQGCMHMTDRQIRDAMGRGQKPEFSVQIDAKEEGGDEDQLNLLVRMSLANSGRGSGRDVTVVLDVPNELQLVAEHRDQGTPFKSVTTFHRASQVREWQVGSLHPGLERCGRLRMRIPQADRKSPGEGTLAVTVYTHDQPPQVACFRARLKYPSLIFSPCDRPADDDSRVCWRWLGE